MGQREVLTVHAFFRPVMLAIRAKKKRKTALNSRTWPKYCVLFNDVI